MRTYTFLLMLLTVGTLSAQVGEVTSEEIVIEKNKEIILPKADKLYLPVNAPELTRDSVKLKFIVSSPQFRINPYLPDIRPYVYSVPTSKLAYQNFVRAGLGSFGSPTLTAYAGQERKALNWGAWVHHEQFARGSVRDAQSASATSYVDVFGTVQNRQWAVTPAIGWQSDSYRFYGYGDGDARISTASSSLSRIRLGATVEEIGNNDFTFKLAPTFYSTSQSTPGNLPSSSENYFDFHTQGTYQIDSAFVAGVNLRMGAIGFESESSINRNFVKVNPWVGIRKSTLFVKVGVEFATTNDTIISGTKSFFYPDLSAEWSGLPGWTVYSGLNGQLKPVTFSSITYENYFLDDSLIMAHENIRMSFTGGIRGAINSKLFLNSGITVSTIENMSFFVPSTFDSARFVMAIDPKAVTVFKWFGGLNWQPLASTQISMNAEVYSYSINTLEAPWYKPGYKLSVDWYQRFTEKIYLQAQLTTLGGIRAPEPITSVIRQLDPIVDLSLQANYKINARSEAFIQVQNVMGKEYERYLNYPNRGVLFRIGGMYRF